MAIFIIASIVWLQVAFLYDYQMSYPIYISIACACIAFGICIYRYFKGYKNINKI